LLNVLVQIANKVGNVKKRQSVYKYASLIAARQRLGKHVPKGNVHAEIEGMLDASFSIVFDFEVDGRPLVGQSVLVSCSRLELMTKFFLSNNCGFLDIGHPH
jgi:hypothetical protein